VSRKRTREELERALDDRAPFEERNARDAPSRDDHAEGQMTAPESPFERMKARGYADQATTLALAFIAARDLDQLCAVLRYIWKAHCTGAEHFDPKRYDMFGFLHGWCFQDFLNVNGSIRANSEPAFEAIQDHARAYLGEPE
jgi:hypothetical protein